PPKAVLLHTLSIQTEETFFYEPTIVSQNCRGQHDGNGFSSVYLSRVASQTTQGDHAFHNRCEGLGARKVSRHEGSRIRRRGTDGRHESGRGPGGVERNGTASRQRLLPHPLGQAALCAR